MEFQSTHFLHSNRFSCYSFPIKSRSPVLSLSPFYPNPSSPHPHSQSKSTTNHIKSKNLRTPLHKTSTQTVFPHSNQYSNFVVRASSSNEKIAHVTSDRFDRPEPFGGKSGSISFYGLTHQVIEEGKLISAPFKEGKGSLLWVLAPVVFISSLVLPQFFLGNVIDSLIQDDLLAEIVTSLSSECMFYIGLATFLFVTDHVQRPYLQFSPKRWGLITGLKGYLSSAFFTMGLKVMAPLLAAYATWPALGLASVVAVAPFLVNCAAQLAFEVNLDKRGSSCWPLIPIIFEVYRLYLLSKAAHFIESMMMSMSGMQSSSVVLERSGALVGLLVSFQVLGVVCLWSLMTFLIRLFPSRPVVEKY